MKIGLCLVIFTIVYLSHVYQGKNFQRHEELVRVRMQLEDALGCYQNNLYLIECELLPRPTKKPTTDRRGIRTFQKGTALVGLVAIFVILAV